MVPIISLLYIIVAGVYLLKLTRGRWLLNPAPLFVLMQLLYFLGSVPLLDIDIEADRIHLYIMFGTLCLFILGALLADRLFPTPFATAKKWFSAPVQQIDSSAGFNFIIWLIIVVSVAISIIYYNAVGYNLFLDSFTSVITGGSALDDVATLRLDAYAGEQYFAPGYVNQFKNVLLPLLLSYLFVRYILVHKKIDLIATLVLTPLCLIFLLGIGQRFPLFMAGLMAAFFLKVSLPAKYSRSMNLVIVVFVFVLLVVLTLILGRSISQVEKAEDIGYLLNELVTRFTWGDQASSVAGFRYIYDLPTQWLNGEWVNGLLMLWPGPERRVGIASEIFFLFYNSTRGTAPPSIWGVVWYDFHLIGIFICPFVFGLMYQGLFARLIRGPKTLFRLLIYTGIFTVLGTWATGGPDYLVNTGLVTIIILKFIKSLWLRKSRASSRQPLVSRGLNKTLGDAARPAL